MLHKLGIIDIDAKSPYHGLQIRTMAVRGELHSVSQAIRNVVHEVLGRFSITVSK